MINLEYLAQAFNELLGKDKFIVYLFTNKAPRDTQGRSVVTLNVLRVPFGYTTAELDAESLNCTLTFDLSCDGNGVIRNQALGRIENMLLGRQVFNIAEADGETYTVNTFFEMQPPSTPRADGGIMQQIVVSGRALVQNEKCKTAVGNDVKVYVDGVQLLKISRAVTGQIGTDVNAKLSEDVTLPEIQGISRAHTKVLEFLYTGKAIEDTFLQSAEGVYFNVNEEHVYKCEYPTFTVSAPFKIVGVEVSDALGVYLQYKITVQVTGDATVEVI